GQTVARPHRSKVRANSILQGGERLADSRALGTGAGGTTRPDLFVGPRERKVIGASRRGPDKESAFDLTGRQADRVCGSRAKRSTVVCVRHLDRRDEAAHVQGSEQSLAGVCLERDDTVWFGPR